MLFLVSWSNIILAKLLVILEFGVLEMYLLMMSSMGKQIGSKILFLLIEATS